MCRALHPGGAGQHRTADVGLPPGCRRGRLRGPRPRGLAGPADHGAHGRHHARHHAGQQADGADVHRAGGAVAAQRRRPRRARGRRGRPDLRALARRGGQCPRASAELSPAFLHRRDRCRQQPHLHLQQPAPRHLSLPERNPSAGAGPDGPVRHGPAGRCSARHHRPATLRRGECRLRGRRAGRAVGDRRRAAPAHRRHAGQRRPDHVEGGQQQHLQLRAEVLPHQREDVRFRQPGGQRPDRQQRRQRRPRRAAHRQRRPAVAQPDDQPRHLAVAHGRRLPLPGGARAGDRAGACRQDDRRAGDLFGAERQLGQHRGRDLRPPQRRRQRRRSARRPGGAPGAVGPACALHRGRRQPGRQRRQRVLAAACGDEHHGLHTHRPRQG